MSARASRAACANASAHADAHSQRDADTRANPDSYSRRAADARAHFAADTLAPADACAYSGANALVAADTDSDPEVTPDEPPTPTPASFPWLISVQRNPAANARANDEATRRVAVRLKQFMEASTKVAHLVHIVATDIVGCVLGHW